MFEHAIQSVDPLTRDKNASLPTPHEKATTVGTQFNAWNEIHEQHRSLLVEDRQSPLSAQEASGVLADGPFTLSTSGDPRSVAEALTGLPATLRDDVVSLAMRFAETMGVGTVQVKLSVIVTDACRKVHTDLTDVRLIATYAGPGTQVAASASTTQLDQLPTGAIGLFKGRAFGDGKAACRHRSPPIEESGGRRLVLVIDTPAFGSNAPDPHYPQLG